ncbi:MAG: alpha/beta hydrolase [Bacteroidota bacterium]
MATTYIHKSSISLLGRLFLRHIKKKGFQKYFIRRMKEKLYDVEEDPIPEKLHKAFSITTSEVKGRNVSRIAPANTSSKTLLLYLHGGGYVNNIKKEHWYLLGKLIKRTGATAVVPNYPLGPGITAEQSFPMVEEVYHQLVGEVGAENIILMGDSAGGGFSMGLVQKLKEEGKPLPQQIILLSPWLDIDMDNPAINTLGEEDPWMDVWALQAAGGLWAGSLDHDHPMVSPIHGSLKGLPQISTFIGGRDLFLADNRKLKVMMEEQGTPINYFEYPHMFHVWMVFPGLREGKKAIKQMAGLILKSV